MKDKRFRIVYVSPPSATGAVSIAGPACEKGWVPSRGCMFCKAKVELIGRQLLDSPETYALFCPNCMEVVVVRKEWPRPVEDDPELMKFIEERLPGLADELLVDATDKFAEYMAGGKAGKA